MIKKYNSVLECSISNNINRGSISRVIKSKKYYIGDFYFFNKKDIDFDFSSIKFLYMYKNNELVDRFLNVKDAINKTNISKSSIYRMMDNKEKDFYFLWK